MERGGMLLLLLIGISSSFFFSYLIGLLRLSSLSGSYGETAQMLFSPPVWLQLLALGAVIPMAEELIFRGFLYSGLRENMSVLTSALFSSAVFGLFHGNIVQGVYGFGVGLVLCWCYEYGGKRGLMCSWAVHGAVNAASVIMSLLFKEIQEDLSFLFLAAVSGICLLMSLLAFRRRAGRRVGGR